VDDITMRRSQFASSLGVPTEASADLAYQYLTTLDLLIMAREYGERRAAGHAREVLGEFEELLLRAAADYGDASIAVDRRALEKHGEPNLSDEEGERVGDRMQRLILAVNECLRLLEPREEA